MDTTFATGKGFQTFVPACLNYRARAASPAGVDPTRDENPPALLDAREVALAAMGENLKAVSAAIAKHYPMLYTCFVWEACSTTDTVVAFRLRLSTEYSAFLSTLRMALARCGGPHALERPELYESFKATTLPLYAELVSVYRECPEVSGEALDRALAHAYDRAINGIYADLAMLQELEQDIRNNSTP